MRIFLVMRSILLYISGLCNRSLIDENELQIGDELVFKKNKNIPFPLK